MVVIISDMAIFVIAIVVKLLHCTSRASVPTRVRTCHYLPSDLVIRLASHLHDRRQWRREHKAEALHARSSVNSIVWRTSTTTNTNFSQHKGCLPVGQQR